LTSSTFWCRFIGIAITNLDADEVEGVPEGISSIVELVIDAKPRSSSRLKHAAAMLLLPLPSLLLTAEFKLLFIPAGTKDDGAE
jgi:hypothetical protein